MATSIALPHQLLQQTSLNVLTRPPIPAASPIVEFQFFHKAIRVELERLHQDALAIEMGAEKEIGALLHRYLFLFTIYKHHSSAEDEVIFPALDLRVKNVAHTYSLEHQEEGELLDQMSGLLSKAMVEKGIVPLTLRRELLTCTEALQTMLCQHLSKEEEQVFPLLMEHFTFEEQAALVWQFMCSIPVNLMEKFLPWLASCLSHEERQEMVACMHEIVPRQELLQQVVFAWLKGGSNAPDAVDSSRPDDKGIISTEFDLMEMGGFAWVDGNECSLSGKKFLINSSVEKSGEMLGGLQDEDLEELAANKECTGSLTKELLYWHNAIHKELEEFADEARQLQILGEISAPKLSSFVERSQFLAEVCNFHRMASSGICRIVKGQIICSPKNTEEEQQFDHVLRLLERVQMTVNNCRTVAQLYKELHEQAESIVETIQHYLSKEEIGGLQLAGKHLKEDEQHALLYQRLRVMPLRLLEQVLPWLVAVLSEEEAKEMLRNMRLAAPVSDYALVTLFSGWACKGHPQNVAGNYRCLSSISVNECPLMKITSGVEQVSEHILDHSKVEGDAKEAGFRHGPDDLLESFDTRPLKRLRRKTTPGGEQPSLEEVNSVAGVEVKQGCGAAAICCAPELGCRKIGARTSVPPSRSLSASSVTPLVSSSLGSGLFGWGSNSGSFSGAGPKPIDHIFQFHKAIRKDLEYLDVESARLADCSDDFLMQFRGRFQFLWGLYRAHSNAEDDIVFPALEAKEALHNVSHSYTIDHKQEEQLFEDISQELLELSRLHGSQTSILALSEPASGVEEGHIHFLKDDHDASQRRALAAKLQRMCKSVRMSLDQHVSREEHELWPLFGVHFTIEEQERIVGRIIGTTGAEVLQAMLPWVTTALTEDEQNTMMDTLRQATRNTMFDKWLSAWWKDTPTSNPHSPPLVTNDQITPPSGTTESLQMVGEKFKPGWRDIFRMNQKELEAAIRKVSSDSSLDPRRKAYLMQNLMTSRWIAAQQFSCRDAAQAGDSPADISGRNQSFQDKEKGIFGCEHYKRNCKVRASCCGHLFPCRFCHDKVSDHSMDRHTTKEMMCMQCLEVQPVSSTCATPSCNGFSMAQYFCSICNFFDNDDRNIYHCPFCNLCRVGKGLGIDYFHCMTCNACMSTQLKEHICREKGLESNCPICHDFLFTSNTPVKALPCGHFMHSACFQAYTCSHYTCPICSKSLGDMAVYFEMLDALLAAEQLPDEYQNRCQDILCNDCEHKGTARFHWLYHKCSVCGSYNTRTI
ncbi:unnamed protein product [Sphagnum jensenii]|uniref:Zinc finger protein n=1 Tax=Sphagnum jensenii TaxID=128206 RepID=A0ABP1BCV6_9BRYO